MPQGKRKPTVRLNYLINKAGWFASYNIRADEVGEPILWNTKQMSINTQG